jgi:hypothetical protein
LNEPEIPLRQVSPTTFQLLEGFRYEVPNGGEVFEIPAHDPCRSPKDENNSTDLASVPQLLWWFIASYGTHTRAALFHDHFVDARDDNYEAPPRARRHEVDRAFERALGESELRWLRRMLVWTAVSLSTSWGPRGLKLIVAHLLALAVLVGWAVLGGPAWPAIMIGLSGFLWGLLRPPETSLSGIACGLGRWPLAILGFVMVGVPCISGWVAQKLALFADLLEEVVASVGRVISRNTPLEPADPSREFKLPKSRPYLQQTGPF